MYCIVFYVQEGKKTPPSFKTNFCFSHFNAEEALRFPRPRGAVVWDPPGRTRHSDRSGAYSKCHWRPVPLCSGSWGWYQRACQKALKRYPVLCWSPSSSNFFPSVKFKHRMSCLGFLRDRQRKGSKTWQCWRSQGKQELGNLRHSRASLRRFAVISKKKKFCFSEIV